MMTQEAARDLNRAPFAESARRRHACLVEPTSGPDGIDGRL